MKITAKKFIQTTSYREDKRSSKYPNVYCIKEMIDFAEMYYKEKLKEKNEQASI